MFRDLTDKDMNQMTEAVVQQIVKREGNKQEVISKHQESYLDALANHLRINRFFDADSFQRDDQETFIEAEEFHLLFDSVIDSAERMGKVFEEDDNPFHNKICYFDFKGTKMIFFIMWGQGTCTQVYIDNDVWDEDRSFTFDDLKAYQTNCNY